MEILFKVVLHIKLCSYSIFLLKIKNVMTVSCRIWTWVVFFNSFIYLFLSALSLLRTHIDKKCTDIYFFVCERKKEIWNLCGLLLNAIWNSYTSLAHSEWGSFLNILRAAAAGGRLERHCQLSSGFCVQEFSQWHQTVTSL